MFSERSLCWNIRYIFTAYSEPCGPSAIFTGKVLGKYKVEENGEQLRYSKRDRQHVVTVVFSWSIRGFLWSGVFFTISINIRCQKAGLGLHIWRWVILQFFLASQRKGINVFFYKKAVKTEGENVQLCGTTPACNCTYRRESMLIQLEWHAMHL